MNQTRRLAFLTPLAACLTACAATPAEPPADPAAIGTWLDNGHIAVRVTHEPNVRVAAVRRSAANDALLRRGPDTYTGLRTQFMDGVSDDLSGATATAPGRIVTQSDRRIIIETLSVTDANLQLSITVALDADGPTFTVTHTLTNTADTPRRMAVWSLASFNREGRGCISFGNAPRPYRTVSYFHWARLPQPSIDMGLRAVTVDFAGELNGSSMKLGVHNDAGWWAYIKDRDALISFVPYDDAATYPEGGDNITTFQGEFPDRAWAELEQVGPLRDVGPGESIVMVERIGLFQLEEVSPDDLAPDALVKTLTPLAESLRVSP